MAGEVSIHVIDVTRGVPAVGMKVETFALLPERQRMSSGFLDGDGMLTTEATDFPRGIYEIVFHVGAFYRSEGIELPDLPFLDEVPFRFGLSEMDTHYRLAVHMSPWGFSLLRGR